MCGRRSWQTRRARCCWWSLIRRSPKKFWTLPEVRRAPHPVGSESKYEFAPMIYRVSGTFRAQDPTIEHRMIRINPMRSGPDTIIRILRSCMEQVEEN